MSFGRLICDGTPPLTHLTAVRNYLTQQIISNPCSWTTIVEDDDGESDDEDSDSDDEDSDSDDEDGESDDDDSVFNVSDHLPLPLEQPMDRIPGRRQSRSWNLRRRTRSLYYLVRTSVSSFLRDADISAVVLPRMPAVMPSRLSARIVDQNLRLSMGSSGFTNTLTSTGRLLLFVFPLQPNFLQPSTQPSTSSSMPVYPSPPPLVTAIRMPEPPPRPTLPLSSPSVPAPRMTRGHPTLTSAMFSMPLLLVRKLPLTVFKATSPIP